MQRIFYVIFCLLYSDIVFASTSVDYGGCWECSLIEGIYIYTFSFVLKIYNVLKFPISTLVLVFFLFWFLWFVWNKLIQNPEKINVSDIAKSVFVKLFTVAFVLGMLSVNPLQIFKVTINPIMNFGTGFGKWILSYAVEESLFKQNVSIFDCEKVSISSKLKDVYLIYDKSYKFENDSSNDDIDTLKDIVCITGIYSNTYNIGLDIGFRFINEGFLGYSASKTAKAVLDVVDIAVDFIPLPLIRSITEIVIKVLKVLAVTETFVALIKIVIGLAIVIAFLYVAFTFISLIIDIIIKLALVGVMLPIVIGSWAFGGGEDIVQLREKLSGKLFWNVLKVSFRLIFLAIAIVISMMLLSELVRVGNLNDINDSTLGIVALLKLLFHPTVIMSIIFTTLISWTLLTESVSMADKISSSLYNGVNDDNILNGIKKLTITSIQFLKNGVQRNVSRYKELEGTRKGLNSRYNDIVNNQSKAKISNYEQEVFSGNFKNLEKIPPDHLMKMYDRMNSDINKDSIKIPSTDISVSNKKYDSISGIQSQSSSSSISETDRDLDDIAISGVNKGLKSIISEEQKFLDDKLGNYEEYKNLSQTQKEDLVDIMIDDKGEALFSNTDKDIVKLAEVVAKNYKTIMPITYNNSIVHMPISSKPLINKFVKFDSKDSKIALSSLRQEYIIEQIISEIDTNKSLLSGKYDKNELKEFIKKPIQRSLITDNKTKNKIKYFDRMYNICEEEILSRNKIKKQQFDEIKLTRNTILYKKLKPKLTAKFVILQMKKDELEDIKADIDNFTLLPPVSRAILSRNLKKLEADVRNLESEESNYDLEDQYQSFVDNYKRHKKRHNRRINPNKIL